MKNKKFSKRTKLIAFGTGIGVCATIMSIMNDTNNKIELRNDIIVSQETYICELEQFIMDNITGYEFPVM